MRRTEIALMLVVGCLVTAMPLRAQAAPPPPIKITLSTLNAGAGEPLTVWFKGSELAGHRIRVYIDRPSNVVGWVTASTTGYGRKTFTLSKYAQSNSRHSLGLLDSSTGHAWSKAFAVDCDVQINGYPGCL